MTDELFPNMIRSDPKYLGFHDLSGDWERDHLVVSGLILTKPDDINECCCLLDAIRKKHDYKHEIKFGKLKDGLSQDAKKNREVASEWLACFENGKLPMKYYGMGFFLRDLLPTDKLKSMPRHAGENLALHWTINSAGGWFLQRFTKIELDLYCDERATPKDLDSKLFFEGEVSFDTKIKTKKSDRKCPEIRIAYKDLVSSSPSKTKQPQHTEMIQLCDLITGSIRGLGNPRFDSEIKRDFAGFIHRWITNKKLGGIFKTSLYGGGDLRFSRFKPKIEQNHAGQENLI